MVWLKPIGFNNTYSLTIRDSDAKKWMDVNSISDLTRVAPNLTLASESEFLERKDGYPGWKKPMEFILEKHRQWIRGLFTVLPRIIKQM
jgi:osmoprotectant transport system permease protein